MCACIILHFFYELLFLLWFMKRWKTMCLRGFGVILICSYMI